MKLVRKKGLEGIVCKRKDSVYEPGKRSGVWQKFKIYQKREFLVGGFLVDQGKVSSVVVGFLDEQQFRYSGKSEVYGVGLDYSLAELRRFKIPHCPLKFVPIKKRDDTWSAGLTKKDHARCCWVKPKISVLVEFIEWTRAGYLRQARLGKCSSPEDQ